MRILLAAAFLAGFALHGWSHPADAPGRDCPACSIGEAVHAAHEAPAADLPSTAYEELPAFTADSEAAPVLGLAPARAPPLA